MSSKQQGKIHRSYLLIALVLVGLATLFAYRHWSGRSGNAGPETTGHAGGGAGKGRPAPVVAQPVHKGDIEIHFTGIGTVTPRNTVTVRTRVDGQLMRVLFREGQTVKAGAPLAEIDPRPFEVQLLQAQGTLAHDQALLDNARIDLERYRTLYEQDSGSRQQWDTQKALVEQYQGAIQSDQAQIDSAKLQLVYCHIKAPISGRTGLRLVDPGNIVHAADSTGLVVITQLQPVTVVFTLPEEQLPAVRKRLVAGGEIPVDAYDPAQQNRLASGVLLAVDNQIDNTTGTIRLKAEFPNQDDSLFPNQFVNADLLVDTLHDVLVLPLAAIQRGVQGTYVYVVGPDQKVAVRPVQLGATQSDRVAVLEGVKAGEQVVVDGADKLRDGASVELGTRAVKAKAGVPAAGGDAAAGTGQGADKGHQHRPAQ
jgi:membrane fusion protein, multidrug efflux system